MRFGAIELGGTNANIAVGSGDGVVAARFQVATGDPESTLDAITDWLGRQGPLAGIGVGAFGPIVIDPAAAGFGRLLATPKPGWSGFDLVSGLRARLGQSVALATDVGAAGTGEAALGALRRVGCGVYLTVGTGIGGAIIVGGRPIPALLHPEIGHLRLRRAVGDMAESGCPFHADCAEGLMAGPAIMRRFGGRLGEFGGDSDEMALVAGYLGQLCASVVLAVAPQRIVIDGGVGSVPGLLAGVRTALAEELAGYAAHGTDDPGFVMAPALGADAALCGALILAAR